MEMVSFSYVMVDMLVSFNHVCYPPFSIAHCSMESAGGCGGSEQTDAHPPIHLSKAVKDGLLVEACCQPS